MLRDAVVCLCTLALVGALAAARGQPVERGSANGPILSQKPCAFGLYEEQPAFTRRFYSKEEYDSAKSSADTECFRITYRSDGLRVVGFLVKPQANGARRYPVIIYNRGGFLDRGKIDTWNLIDFERLSEEGFVVLASQYRGNDGGEGRDEVGGGDLDDVVNLLQVAEMLPYADTKNVFMYGLSRGGMMTFLAMKQGLRVNAAAVVGAVYDIEAFGRRAPGILGEATALMPDYRSHGLSALKERSAINWPEKIDAPLLMLHGGDDDEVPATEALAFATKLSMLKKTYEFVIYANDVHEVENNRRDRDARIIRWFRRYIR